MCSTGPQYNFYKNFSVNKTKDYLNLRFLSMNSWMLVFIPYHSSYRITLNTQT